MNLLSQDHTLENERVLLRPLRMEDQEHLLPFALKEPELWTYSLVQGGSEELLKSYIASAILGREQSHSYPFIIYDKREGRYAGSTRFYDLHEKHRSVLLGFTWLGKEFQGNGLNVHCKQLLLTHAFETWNMHRVEFRADARNAHSIAAMKGIGCTVEGVLRSNCAAPEGRRDSIVLSILKPEWESGVKERLQERIIAKDS